MKCRTFLRPLFALLVAFDSTLAPAMAQAPATSAISGRILETSAGLPVAGAKVDLRRGESSVATTVTAADGSFRIDNVAPGDYSLLITATHYQSALISGVRVLPGTPLAGLQTALTPLKAGLKEIASVAVSTHSQLQTSATLNSNLPPSIIQDQNYARAGDALGTLPWVTTQTSSSIGDDETVSLRGFDPTESVALIDGHPIGPIGACPSQACPINNQGSVFDYQLAEFWGLGNINVIYGSGATGLYAVPTLGGAVDFETINPTPTDHFTATQGIGMLDKAMTGLSATGTAGHLGYAIAYGVQGLDGEVVSPVLQNANLANALSNCTNAPTNTAYANAPEVPPTLKAADVAACTYPVSGTYLNRNFVGKLTYQFDTKTSLLVSAYDATDYADSTGNGDTDYEPYPDVLYEANGLLSSGSNNFQLLSGANTTCSKTTIAVLNDSQRGYGCLTAPQYATAFSGPYGSGIGRFHNGLLQDYHARATRRIGNGQLIVDGYVDNYDYLNVKGPSRDKWEQDSFLTHGALVKDEYDGSKHDFSFGIAFQHQLHETNQYDTPIFGPPNLGFFVGDTSYFVHDTYTPSDRLSIFADLDLDHSQYTSTDSFDPRLSFVYRPTNEDVFRLSGGRATISPDPVLLSGGFSFSNTIASFEQSLPGNCGDPLVNFGTGDSPYVQPEQANDLELAAAHRFAGGVTLEADAYDTVETNPIVAGVYPLSVVPLAQRPTAVELAPYINLLDRACGRSTAYTDADFGVQAPFNAAQADYHGLNLTAKIPLTRQFELDGGYAIQSAYYTGIPNEDLQLNTNYANYEQFYEIPIHTASIGAGYTSKPGGMTARIDGYYVGANNGFNRPAYWYANGNVARTIGQFTLNLGVSNIFNSVANQYGLIGLGSPEAQNQYGQANSTAFQQGAEEFFLPYRQIWVTGTFHI